MFCKLWRELKSLVETDPDILAIRKTRAQYMALKRVGCKLFKSFSVDKERLEIWQESSLQVLLSDLVVVLRLNPKGELDLHLIWSGLQRAVTFGFTDLMVGFFDFFAFEEFCKTHQRLLQERRQGSIFCQLILCFEDIFYRWRELNQRVLHYQLNKLSPDFLKEFHLLNNSYPSTYARYPFADLKEPVILKVPNEHVKNLDSGENLITLWLLHWTNHIIPNRSKIVEKALRAENNDHISVSNEEDQIEDNLQLLRQVNWNNISDKTEFYKQLIIICENLPELAVIWLNRCLLSYNALAFSLMEMLVQQIHPLSILRHGHGQKALPKEQQAIVEEFFVFLYQFYSIGEVKFGDGIEYYGCTLSMINKNWQIDVDRDMKTFKYLQQPCTQGEVNYKQTPVKYLKLE